VISFTVTICFPWHGHFRCGYGRAPPTRLTNVERAEAYARHLADEIVNRHERRKDMDDPNDVDRQAVQNVFDERRDDFEMTGCL